MGWEHESLASLLFLNPRRDLTVGQPVPPHLTLASVCEKQLHPPETPGTSLAGEGCCAGQRML